MMKKSNRVVFNTCIQYGRMLITVGVNLYSTRLILSALGAVDYGIYNLIAGVIALLAFLNTAMSITTQRYLSVGQGKIDNEYQKIIFANSFWLHIGIGIIVVLLSEVAGIYLFDGFLNIAPERINVAKQLFHFMMISVFLTITNVPFSATLMAHENFLWPAILMILNALLNLGIALFLHLIDGDRLFFYGVCMILPVFLNFMLQSIYCFHKYSESWYLSMHWVKWKVLHELLCFAGWNLIHALCTVGTTQGIAILLNLFFGTIVNAAYGIANQVAGQINFFANSMLVAMNPQIMKAEGAGDRKQMLRLSMLASKWGFFLLAFIAIPCIFEMPAILGFWLKEVPEYTTDFCRLIIIAVLMNQLTIGLTTAAQAIGKLKTYTLVVCTIRILVIPVGYLLLRKGYSSIWVLGSYVFFEGLASVIRLFLLKMIGGLSIKLFINKVFKKEYIAVVLLLVFNIVIAGAGYDEGGFWFIIPLEMILFWSVVYCFGGLDEPEKEFINKIWQRLKLKI